MSDQIPTTIPPQVPAQRRHRPRWLLPAALLVVAAIVIAGGWVAVPRLLNSVTVHRFILNKLQSRLGLRIDVHGIRIDFAGKTTLTDVRVGLPLRHWPFARIAKIVIHHNNVAWIMLTGQLGITEISVHAPRVILHAGEQGQWNLPAAWQDLHRAWAAWKRRHVGADLAALGLPEVTINQGALMVEFPQHRELAIDHITFHGQPTSALTWRLSLHAASTDLPGASLRAHGILVPSQSWLHSIHVQAVGLGPGLKKLWPAWSGAASASAQLRGSMVKNALHERLSDARIELGEFSLGGSAKAQYAGDHWQIDPEHIGIGIGYLHLPINVYRGQIWADSRGFHVQGLRADLAGGGVHLSGVMNPADASATLKVAWHGISMFGTEMQNGTLAGSLSSPWPGKRIIALNLTSTGQSAYGTWNTALAFSAQGRFHGTMRWQLDAPQLSWQRARLVTLRGLHVTGTYDHQQLTVSNCTLASDPYLNLSGTYNLPLQLWRVHLRATAAGIPLLHLPTNVHLHVSAYGNGGGMQLENLLVQSPVWSLAASGNCIFAGHYPTHLIVTVTGIPLVNHAGTGNAGWALGGLISGKLLADGEMMPLALHVDGRLAGTHFTVNHHRLALPEVHVVGRLTRTRIVLAANPAAVLGGHVRVQFNADTSGRLAGLTLEARHVSAAAVSALLLAKPPANIHGTLGINLKINVPARHLRMATIKGSITADHLTIPSPKALTAPIDIVHASAALTYAHGLLTLDPINLSGVGGSAVGQASWRQTIPTDIALKVRTTDWPVSVSRLRLATLVTGKMEGRYNWRSMAMHGTGDVKLGIFQHLLPIGLAGTHIVAVGRLLSFQHTTLDILGNTLKGQGIWNIDHPLASSAIFNCNLPNVQPLLKEYSWANGLKGTFAGNLVLGPTAGAHPLAPLELRFNLNARHASLGAIELGTLGLHVFISDHALVLDRSSLAFAGGTMRLWARISSHNAGLLSSDCSLSFQNINLDQLTHTVRPKAQATPGLLSGRLTAVALSNNWRNAIGSGNLQITQSNLTGSTIMSSIYRLMNVQLSAKHPTGSGEARWRIDGGNAQITYLHYFDKGVEVLGAGELDNIWKMPDSKIRGYVIGTVRPVKNFHVPFIPQAKAVLNALESSVSTVRVGGTWAHPTATPVVFHNLGQAIQETFVKAIVGRQSSGSEQ